MQHISDSGVTTVIDSEDLTINDIFHVLRNQRRRYILHYLKYLGESSDIGTVADHVTAWENRKSVGAITSRERKRVYNSLQQTHLPELDDLGVVVYDSARGRIELTDRIEDFDVYMEIVPGRDLPWHEYYLGLGAVSMALMTAVFADVVPFTMLPDIAWGGFVTVAFTFSAIAHFYYTRKTRLGGSELPPELQLSGDR